MPIALVFAVTLCGAAALSAPTASLEHTGWKPRRRRWRMALLVGTKPVLRAASGDILDVDTLLTSTPDRLEKAGVPAATADQVTTSSRGPSTWKAPSRGDALEVRVLSIDLALAYGYSGCAGFIRENCTPGAGPRIIRMDRKRMIATFAPGIEIPPRPFFLIMGVAPPPERAGGAGKCIHLPYQPHLPHRPPPASQLN